MAKKIEGTEEKKFLTYEEVEAERKRLSRERINTALRVVGLFTTILMIVNGLFDLYELSYFGKIADAINGTNYHETIWSVLTGTHGIEGLDVGKIYDDKLQINVWLPKSLFTLLIAGGAAVAVYLITFSFVDFVAFAKNIVESGKEITNINANNVKEALPGLSMFKKKKNDDETDEDNSEDILPKKKRRRNTKNEYGYSDAQLDALLRGEKIEAQKEIEESKNKSLFEETEE